MFFEETEDIFETTPEELFLINEGRKLTGRIRRKDARKHSHRNWEIYDDVYKNKRECWKYVYPFELEHKDSPREYLKKKSTSPGSKRYIRFLKKEGHVRLREHSKLNLMDILSELEDEEFWHDWEEDPVNTTPEFVQKYPRNVIKKEYDYRRLIMAD